MNLNKVINSYYLMGNLIRIKTDAVYILLSILRVNIFIDLMFLVRIFPCIPILTLPVP